MINLFLSMALAANVSINHWSHPQGAYQGELSEDKGISLEYPENYIARMNFTSSFGNFFSKTYCDTTVLDSIEILEEIRSLGEVIPDPEHEQLAIDTLRKGMSVQFDLDLIPFLHTNDSFNQNIREQLGSTSPVSRFEKINAKELRIKINAKSDALVRRVGQLDELEKSLNSLLNDDRVFTARRSVPANFKQHDLMCDLLSGKATLSLELDAEIENDELEYDYTVDLNEVRAIHTALKDKKHEWRKQYRQVKTKEDRLLLNGALVFSVLRDYYQEDMNMSDMNKKFFVFHGALFSSYNYELVTSVTSTIWREIAQQFAVSVETKRPYKGKANVEVNF